jgi:hypothetical protein
MAKVVSRRQQGWYAASFVAAILTAVFVWLESKKTFDYQVAESAERTTTLRRVLTRTPLSAAEKSRPPLQFEDADDETAISPTLRLFEPAVEPISRRSVESSSASIRPVVDYAASARLQPPQPVPQDYSLDASGFLSATEPGVSKASSTETESSFEHQLSRKAATLPDDLTSPFQKASFGKQGVTKPGDLARIVSLDERLTAFPAGKLSGLQALRNTTSELGIDAIAAGQPEIERWTTAALHLLDEIETGRRIASTDTRPSAALLTELAHQMLQHQPRLATDLELQSRVDRLAYALIRRAAVTESLDLCVGTNQSQFVATDFVRPDLSALPKSNFGPAVNSGAIDIATLRLQVAALEAGLVGIDDEAAWRNFLMIDRLKKLASPNGLSATDAAEVAQQFLTRARWQEVTKGQRQFLDQQMIGDLITTLRLIAVQPIDFQVVRRNLDQIEVESISRARDQIGRVFQMVRHSQNPTLTNLGAAIDTHYRNANMRFAVSEDFIQRFLPEATFQNRPVRETILGARTMGDSQVNTQLSVALQPDPEKWNLKLGLTGVVESQTRSSRGPATFFNASSATVDTARHIVIDEKGLSVLSQEANVSSNDALRGFRTDFDALPILGDIVRYIAREQFDQKRGIAQRIVRRKIARETDKEFDRQLATGITNAESQVEARILNPLGQLDLNPMVVDMKTTESRLVARYRVAGSSQLAAHTPRPLAPSDALLSFQLHESVINNTIDQIGLGDRYWSLQELCDKLAVSFKQNPWKVPDEVPADVKVRFAESRPITIEFDDDRMQLTLRIRDIQHSADIRLNRFVIKVGYKFVPNGLGVELVQDGVVSVDGYRMSAGKRLPLRGIFCRVFATRQVVPLIQPELTSDPRTAGIAISQIVLKDGWLGLAVSAENSPHVAALQSPDQIQR